jgi:hypothetical protein
MSERHEDLMHSMEKTMDRLVNAADEIGIQLGRMNDTQHTKPEPAPAKRSIDKMVDAALDSLLLSFPDVPYISWMDVECAIEAALAAQDTGDAAEKCARCKGRGRYWEIHEYEDQEWITCPPCRGTGHAP